MAVYWMAIDAKASSTMDFQEHCMVVRTGALGSHSTVCKTRGQIQGGTVDKTEISRQ